jgi:hypothetical protein
MSRSGYIDDGDDDDQWGLIRWRGAVKSALRGARGQAFLRELLTALDAMPEKRLASDSLITADGEFCTMGVVGAARGVNLDALDPEDCEQVAQSFGLAEAMVREIVYENDERVAEWGWEEVDVCGPMRPYYPEWGSHKRSVRVPINDAAERRWQHMRAWAAKHIKVALVSERLNKKGEK